MINDQLCYMRSYCYSNRCKKVTSIVHSIMIICYVALVTTLEFPYLFLINVIMYSSKYPEMEYLSTNGVETLINLRQSHTKLQI